MNPRHLLSAAAVLLVLAQPGALSAGDDKQVAHEASEMTSPAPFRFAGEFTIETSYVGDSEVARDRRQVNFDELYTNLRFVYTPRVKYGIIRAGAQLERYSFGFDGSGQQLPNTLQALNAVIGFDTRLGDSILVRLEAQPGLYGTSFDALSGDQFNIPFVLGGTYIVSPDLQLIFGVGVNFQQNYPILPGGGVRWKFAPQWVLNAVLPTPRLEYAATSNVTVFVGGDIKANTFRVDDRFGSRNGDRRLNNAWLSYEEVRAGAGAEWKLNSSFTLKFEGGYVPYRQFDYFRTDVRYHHEQGGAYGAVVLQGNF